MSSSMPFRKTFGDSVETNRVPALDPLRILMVVDGQYPATGGAEMQARLLCTAFAQQGHQVRVLAPRLQASQAKFEVIDGIAVRRLSYPRVRGLGSILLDLRFAAYLLRHRREFDAIHIHMVRNLAGAAGWVRRLVGIPMVAKVSGADEFRGGILDPALMHRPIHRLLNAGAKRIDAFQCISQHTRRAMLEAGYPAARMHPIPNAVDCARFACNRTDAPLRRVVFVGRHVPVKGIDVLLRAWALVRRPAELRLVLAGNGPEHDKLRSLARELGVQDSVDFPGAVSHVPEILADAGLYVQASHQEGLPNAVLEAMASGLAVVATRVSGHEDVVAHGSTGLLVPPNDPAALAAAMQTLLDDSDLRLRMGRAGRAAIERTYCAEIVTASLLRLYRGAHPTAPATETRPLHTDGHRH
ncbi:MAG: glycosyltransferase family 4 protein [Thiomonas sp.]